MIKLQDYKELDTKKFIKIAQRRLNNIQNAEDEVYDAYLELLKQNKEYNNIQHLEATLSLRILSRRLDKKRRLKFRKFKSMEFSIDWLLYKNYSETQKIDVNYDANKILKHLSLKTGKGRPPELRVKVFKTALDCNDRGLGPELAKELGISKENYKTTLLDARRIAKEFYYKELK